MKKYILLLMVACLSLGCKEDTAKMDYQLGDMLYFNGFEASDSDASSTAEVPRSYTKTWRYGPGDPEVTRDTELYINIQAIGNLSPFERIVNVRIANEGAQNMIPDNLFQIHTDLTDPTALYIPENGTNTKLGITFFYDRNFLLLNKGKTWELILELETNSDFGLWNEGESVSRPKYRFSVYVTTSSDFA